MSKLFLCSFLLSQLLCAQFSPPIQNFKPRQYSGENQNWSITQDNSGKLYFANNHHLLEYNGVSWKSYESPNNSVLRSLLAVDNKVYTGCFMEFGYWQRDNKGILHYTSLAQQVKDQIIEDEQFWNIYAVENQILFQSLSRIYSFNTKTKRIAIIDAEAEVPNLFQVGNQLLLHQKNKGFFEVNKIGAQQLINIDAATKEDIIGKFDRNDATYFIQKNGKIKQLKSSSLRTVDFSFISLPKNIAIYSTYQLSNGNLVLGSISHGVFLVDFKNQTCSKIDRVRD